ncbi:type II toxin-antitoxin system HicA family toxin [Loigolactobacillus iwatensis]|uniref:type II toxin-antitoxin system HicA family toxin n=1 Tax=Loigolactobacillus iwatensis TaxID=1267156 RepID=UPI000F7F8F6E|nr:type II toxin-antitoxin system HicA family toxin [Loigolactobacillus iwatensis]
MTEIKAKKVVKQLLDAGFYDSRINGDHHRFKDDEGHYVTVNYSRLSDSIKPGTYSAILRQAGLKKNRE